MLIHGSQKEKMEKPFGHRTPEGEEVSGESSIQVQGPGTPLIIEGRDFTMSLQKNSSA
jgi:hypothetical protein